jgi:hypothetical protein
MIPHDRINNFPTIPSYNNNNNIIKNTQHIFPSYPPLFIDDDHDNDNNEEENEEEEEIRAQQWLYMEKLMQSALHADWKEEEEEYDQYLHDIHHQHHHYSHPPLPPPTTSLSNHSHHEPSSIDHSLLPTHYSLYLSPLLTGLSRSSPTPNTSFLPSNSDDNYSYHSENHKGLRSLVLRSGSIHSVMSGGTTTNSGGGGGGGGRGGGTTGGGTTRDHMMTNTTANNNHGGGLELNVMIDHLHACHENEYIEWNLLNQFSADEYDVEVEEEVVEEEVAIDEEEMTIYDDLSTELVEGSISLSQPYQQQRLDSTADIIIGRSIYHHHHHHKDETNKDISKQTIESKVLSSAADHKNPNTEPHHYQQVNIIRNHREDHVGVLESKETKRKTFPNDGCR